MKRMEIVELGLICLVACTTWVLWRSMPVCLTAGEAVLGCAGLVLAQSLVRDLFIILRRKNAGSNAQPRQAQCLCVESAVGVTGVLAGASLAVLATSSRVCPGRWGYTLGVGGTMALCFLIKDLVVSWNPWAIRREPDHINLIVRLRPGPK